MVGSEVRQRGREGGRVVSRQQREVSRPRTRQRGPTVVAYLFALRNGNSCNPNPKPNPTPERDPRKGREATLNPTEH